MRKGLQNIHFSLHSVITKKSQETEFNLKNFFICGFLEKTTLQIQTKITQT